MRFLSSRQTPRDVQECLAAFNRSEQDRLLPLIRRTRSRIFLTCVALLVLLGYCLAVLWEMHH